jgi:soluble lytic murein transglycosylase
VRTLVCAALLALSAGLVAPTSARDTRRLKASDLWLAPVQTRAASSDLAIAVQALADGKAAAALPVFTRAVRDPVIGAYARLYQGRAELALNHIPGARTVATGLLAARPDGYLREAALLFAADAADAADDAATVVKDLTDLLPQQPASPATVWLRLGQADAKMGDRDRAMSAFTKIYYDYPLSAEADDAAKELASPGRPGTTPTRETFSRALTRAQALFDARRFSDARKAFDAVWPLANGEEHDLIALRLAECDLNAKKYAAARDGLLPLVDNGPRQVEARFNTLGALRGLGKGDDYVAAVRALVSAHPDSPFAEEALNDLGSYDTTGNEDAKAADVFAELYRRYPSGAHAERAAWRSGWWAYKNGTYAETVRVFEDAAERMAHADTRPAWLYWAAKAHQRLGDRGAAIDGYRRTIAAYRNLYYGREAARELRQLDPANAGAGSSESRGASPVRRATPPALRPGDPPPSAPLVTRLLEAGMYDEAIGELRYAERASGSSPLIQATFAYAWSRKGELRTGIQLMKRAYPQYMAAGGEALPEEIQRVIFPVAYWDVITKYATAQKLDPYLMAALIAQESTFQADVKSAANAWGLMQIVPATGRRYAQHLGIKPFSTARLTDPTVNIRIGMAYFADLTRQFNNIPAALASYNAGENRAARWLAERPGIERDEFIDDIPFPETQGYVKRILSTAEDYRQLYPKPAAARR